MANAQLLASRFLDAEHLYQAAVVGISKNITREKLSYLCDCSSLAQLSNDRTDDAVFSLLKSISFDPDHFQSWYNLAVLRKVSATKNNKISATELEQAIFDLQFASEIFERLLNFHKTAALDKKMLAKQRTLSTINVVKLKEQLETVREVEQKKKVSREKQELEHSAAIQRKKDETLKLHIMLEESKKEQQKIAKERDNRRIRDDSAPFPEANEGLSDDESIEKLLGKRKISESE